MPKRGNKSKSRVDLTQRTLEESFGEVVDPSELADNVIRYIIYRGGEHMNFTKSELTRNVIHKAGGKFEEIITRVRVILNKVYGYNMMVCDSTKGKDKQYVISNILPHIDDPSENREEIPEDANNVLLLLILSHIFMSNNMVSDVSLYSFLKSCGIDVNLKHPIFGHVKEHINKALTKKQYLITEIDQLSKRQTFKWGLRAEKEISKMAVLKFVCKMFKDRQPKDWINQYQVANQQAYENYPQGSVPMEVETQESQE